MADKRGTAPNKNGSNTSLCIHVYQIIKNRGPGPYNSLRHADNIKYFSLSNTKSMESAHVSFGEGSGKIWRCSC